MGVPGDRSHSKGIEIFLDAYVLPDDHEVWKCFPGETYRFLQAVYEAKAVFLDIRGLEELDPDPGNWQDADVLRVISEDRWKRELEKESRGKSARGTPDVSSEDRKRLTFLKGLLFEAKKGDLIVLPADGYRREVLIGELLEDPGVVTPVMADHNKRTHEFVGRPVRWLPSKEKREFKADAIASLHSSNAFHLLARSARAEVYEVAYENYIYNHTFVATFKTTKQNFTTSDNAVVSVWFNALAAAYSAYRGEPLNLAHKSFSDLGLISSAEAQRGELSIDIASPGSVLLHSFGVFALATMALFPAMEADAKTLLEQPITVQLRTVGSADDRCALEVSAAAEGIVKTLSLRRLQDACEVRTRAEKEATLHTKARLKN
jgi:hypothetical protein